MLLYSEEDFMLKKWPPEEGLTFFWTLTLGTLFEGSLGPRKLSLFLVLGYIKS